jgi:hypothetical protein
MTYPKIKFGLFNVNIDVLYLPASTSPETMTWFQHPFVNFLSKDKGMESYDGLDARPVVHVHGELLTTRGIRPTLISSMMYPFIISIM